MLGRTYTLTGKVVRGQQLGRTLGFPTANLEISPDKLLPRHGVYCVRVKVEPQSDRAGVTFLKGVMNIGLRPTVAGADRPTVEVHILDWDGDMYGSELAVSLEQFIRPEQKFTSLEGLKAKIREDCQQARQILPT
jgi:riboflavin kinase/FMN adenylyltransferase